MKESFLLYKSTYSAIKDLSLADKGLLLDAIFQYNIDGITIDLPPVLGMAFRFMKDQFDRDAWKYESISERNRKNGLLGGRPRNNPDEPKKPSGFFENPDEPKKPKKPDTDTDIDTETVSDSGTDDDDDYDLYEFYQSSSSNFREENSEKLQKDISRTVKTFGTEKIQNAISRAAASWYCNGYNETGVRASLTWILKSIEKILAGEYDSHGLPLYSQAGVKFSDHQRMVLRANEPGLIGKMKFNAIDWNAPVPPAGPSRRRYKTRSEIVRDNVSEAAEDLTRRMYENQQRIDNGGV